MFLQKIHIERNSLINDIVKKNHHTADVFRKYGIEYCCGGKWPLETVCMTRGLAFDELKNELEMSGRVIQMPPGLDFNNWDIDFLTRYIVNVHHQYLKSTLPDTGKILRRFADEHIKKYPYVQETASLFEQLQKEILPHIKYEEETIFPYIRQVVHAHENNDTYGKLLVKTLRKPLGVIMRQEDDVLIPLILKIRVLTNNYTAPENACISHTVALSGLKDLDNDLLQHIYLENKILFPRAMAIEHELLK